MCSHRAAAALKSRHTSYSFLTVPQLFFLSLLLLLDRLKHASHSKKQLFFFAELRIAFLNQCIVFRNQVFVQLEQDSTLVVLSA